MDVATLPGVDVQPAQSRSLSLTSHIGFGWRSTVEPHSTDEHGRNAKYIHLRSSSTRARHPLELVELDVGLGPVLDRRACSRPSKHVITAAVEYRFEAEKYRLMSRTTMSKSRLT